MGWELQADVLDLLQGGTASETAPGTSCRTLTPLASVPLSRRLLRGSSHEDSAHHSLGSLPGEGNGVICPPVAPVLVDGTPLFGDGVIQHVDILKSILLVEAVPDGGGLEAHGETQAIGKVQAMFQQGRSGPEPLPIRPGGKHAED